jgi:hypothetical protein
VYVEGLSEWVVKTPSEIYGLMERGASQRATGSTKMNELSSRSHAVRAFPNHRAPPSRLRILVPEGTITSDCLRNTRYDRLTLTAFIAQGVHRDRGKRAVHGGRERGTKPEFPGG